MVLVKEDFSFSVYKKSGVILVSYLVFLFTINLFGKGYSALPSLLIVLFSAFISILIVMKYTMKLVFKKIDYYFVVFIFLLQIGIGVFHFVTYIEPGYFTSSPGINLGVNSIGQTLHTDFQIIAYKMSKIAEYKLKYGYFSIDTVELLQKYYVISYLLSDLFYFADIYIMNFIAINILSVFYSGVLLALLVYKIYEHNNYKYSRKVFYLTILQPFAWIPSHSMRDVFGALLIVFSVFLIYGASKRFKPIAYMFAMLLSFPHRAVYALSFLMIIGIGFLERIKLLAYKIIVTTIMIVSAYLVIKLAAFQVLFGNGMNEYLQNASFSFIKIFQVIIGPFPWTQYLSENTTYIASLYATIFCLQASFGIALLITVFLSKSIVFTNQKTKAYFNIVLIFAIPSFFSYGGHNIYLLPSMFLILPLLSRVPIKKTLIIFSIVTLGYALLSLFYTTAGFSGAGLLKVAAI